MTTRRLTMAQALVLYLTQQHVARDGKDSDRAIPRGRPPMPPELVPLAGVGTRRRPKLRVET